MLRRQVGLGFGLGLGLVFPVFKSLRIPLVSLAYKVMKLYYTAPFVCRNLDVNNNLRNIPQEVRRTIIVFLVQQDLNKLNLAKKNRELE